MKYDVATRIISRRRDIMIESAAYEIIEEEGITARIKTIGSRNTGNKV